MAGDTLHVQKLALNCLCGCKTVCCLCNEQLCVSVAVVTETCAQNLAAFLGMTEVEEKYILGSFMIVSSHDVLLLS